MKNYPPQTTEKEKRSAKYGSPTLIKKRVKKSGPKERFAELLVILGKKPESSGPAVVASYPPLDKEVHGYVDSLLWVSLSQTIML